MSDRWKMPQPSVYVPHGHVPLKEALVRAAEAIRPMDNVRGFVFSDEYMIAVNFDPLREPPEDVPDPFSWPRHATPEFAALEEARERIRWFLAEGHLATVGQRHDGELVSIVPGFWRTDAGANALRFPFRVEQYTQIFITDEAMGSWLGDVPHWYSLGQPSGTAKLSGNDEAPAQSPSSPKGVSKSKLESWLVEQMTTRSAAVERGKTKAFDAAKTQFGPALSYNFFNAGWKVATKKAGRHDLIRGGRRPSIDEEQT